MYTLTNKLLTKAMLLMVAVLFIGVLSANAMDIESTSPSNLEKIESDINAFTITPNSSYATCSDSPDGSATIINNGGVNPLSFAWSTGETTSNIFGLLPGDYGVTVTDATGCVATTVVTVMVGPEGVWLMATSTPASCGACDGTADPMASLGVQPYTYLWSDGQTTPIATGLCSGEISVTVTDAQGCSNSTTVFVGSQGNLTVSGSATDASCTNDNGTATATPSGGMGPFTYSWSNGGTTQTITGLSAGTYTVTVTSAEGCVGVTTVVVGGGITTLDGNASSTATDCGVNDGTATVTATGGVAPYTYLWSNGATTATIMNLPPAIYSVTITDAEGCTVTLTVEVAGSSAPEAGTISTDDETTICAGDGVPDPITVNTMGGTQGASTQYLVTDANGNILLLPTSNVIDLEGAGPGLCLIWCLVYDDVVNGVEVGNNASDIEGCFDLSNNIPVDRLSTEPATISTNDPTEFCVGDMEDDLVDVTVDDAGMGANSAWIITDGDGLILALPMFPPFNFEETGSGNCLIWYLNYEDVTGVELGANANDLEGCFSLSDPIEVIRNATPEITVSPTDAVICPGESVDLSTTVSEDGVTYEWFASAGLLSNTDQASTTYTMMMPGVYQIIVSATTPEGCMGIAMTTVTVLEGPDVTLSDDPNGNSICEPGQILSFGASSSDPNATFTWTASGGTIDSEGSEVSYIMMMPGTYTITVVATSENGCTSTTTTTATVGIFEATASESSPITNCGLSDGAATVSTSGGNGDFTYEWSTGASTATISDLPEGDYSVTVTDVLSGCTQESTVLLSTVGFAIGNYVFVDNSEDCLQDTNEQGLEGVPVNLVGPGPDGLACTADDVIIETTNTDADGFYQFICLEPGTYYIQFFATVVYNGFEYTCIDGDGSGSTGDMMTNNDDLDSDANPDDGKTMPFDILDLDGDGLPETIDMDGDGVNDKNPDSFDAGVVEICNNVTSGGQVDGGQTLCPGEVPDKIDSVVPAGGGGNSPIEYLWICSPTPGVPNPGSWTPIPDSNTECLQLGPVFETRYYARCARREGCPEFIFESNVVCIELESCAQILNVNTSLKDDDGIQISWITSNDNAGSTYLVERSLDEANFEVLSEMPSIDADLNQYTFIDEQPEKGMNYYRVRRVSADGTYQFSNIAEQMFTVKSEEMFGIYPNPVSGTLTLENFEIVEGAIDIQIISAAGIAKTGMKMDASNYTKEDINLNDLPTGVYYLRILHSDDQVELIKFTKID